MNFAAKNLTMGELNALVKRLEGEDNVRNFLRNNLELKLIPPKVFPTWKTVTVGNLSNAKTARQQLEDSGIKISDWGGDILDRMMFEDTEVRLDLVRVSVKELGLETGATTAEIYAAAARHGLSLCLVEVATQLWLSCPDLLPCGEWTMVAMEATLDLNDDRNVLLLVHNNTDHKLSAEIGRLDCEWDACDCWVFVQAS